MRAQERKHLLVESRGPVQARVSAIREALQVHAEGHVVQTNARTDGRVLVHVREGLRPVEYECPMKDPAERDLGGTRRGLGVGTATIFQSQRDADNHAKRTDVIAPLLSSSRILDRGQRHLQ